MTIFPRPPRPPLKGNLQNIETYDKMNKEILVYLLMNTTTAHNMQMKNVELDLLLRIICR